MPVLRAVRGCRTTAPPLLIPPPPAPPPAMQFICAGLVTAIRACCPAHMCRAWNERGAATDAIACRLASRLHLLHLVKLWLANRLPGGTAIAGKRGASIQLKRNCKWMRSNSALRVCTRVPSQPPAHLPDLCAVPLLLACLPHSLITEGLALLAERRRAW